MKCLVQASVGDCVFYLENNRPVSEFLAVIWIFYLKFKTRLPVKVADVMKFARPNKGINVGDIFPKKTSRFRSPSFKKLGARKESISWPIDDSSHKHTSTDDDDDDDDDDYDDETQ